MFIKIRRKKSKTKRNMMKIAQDVNQALRN